MNFRQRTKYWLYGRCPGFAGRFPYHGIHVHFPKGSLIFQLACANGIYEAANLRVLLSAVKPNSLAFDVGANIGLMSAPLLSKERTLQVISVEPSPNTYACLQRTVADSPYGDRWTAKPVALGEREGTVDFFCADPALALFDGIKDTQRAGATRRVTVPLTTLDSLWIARHRPDVCVIKIDVEGADLGVLQGARECIRTRQPLLMVEWNSANLASYGCAEGRLLSFAQEVGYAVYAMPTLVRAESEAHLRALMQFEESFVLLPVK